MLKENRDIANKNTINGSTIKIAIVVAEFNKDITHNMFLGAQETLKQYGVTEENITVVNVPGAFEIPFVCNRIALAKTCDAIIALGAVIRGDTDHHLYVAGEASRGIMDVMLKRNIPIGFGIITTNTLEQARERSEGKHNKGSEAALVALQMARLQIKN
jgi:6,7-dimethyl-8-ribityllumazine synthase